MGFFTLLQLPKTRLYAPKNALTTNNAVLGKKLVKNSKERLCSQNVRYYE